MVEITENRDDAEKKALAFIQNVLEGKIDVNSIDENGMTALHHAAARNNFEAAQALLIMGIDHGLMDNYRKTALHYAQNSSSTRLVEILTKKIVESC